MRSFWKLNWRRKLKRIYYAIANYHLWRITRFISNCFYWLRTHTYNRYHIINIKSPNNGYKWGWIDRDHAMFYGMFHLLCDFVEKEMFPHSSTPSVAGIKLSHKHALEKAKIQFGEESWEYRACKDQFGATDKLLDLYWWYKFEHPEIRKPQEGDWDYVYKLETQKMRELLDVRDSMWT